MGNIRLREILILFLVLWFFINFFYYRYIFVPNRDKMKGLQEEIKKLDTEIDLKTEEFLKRIKVFDEIIDLKNQIKQK